MRKKINLNGIVVDNQTKRRTRSDRDEVAKQISEQTTEVNHLTDKDGLDRSYIAERKCINY